MYVIDFDCQPKACKLTLFYRRQKHRPGLSLVVKLITHVIPYYLIFLFFDLKHHNGRSISLHLRWQRRAWQRVRHLL